MSVSAHALQAVSYTRQVLGNYPSNLLRTRILTLGDSTRCVEGMRVSTQSTFDRDIIMNLRRRAAAAKSRRCGNCGEYAAVAFDFLILTNCPYTVEYAYYASPGDHAFVIVGRPVGSVVADPSSWGREAAVCDAWAGRVVPARNYWASMVGFPRSVHAPVVLVRWPVIGDYPIPPGVSVPA
jgi:hypothetical protein